MTIALLLAAALLQAPKPDEKALPAAGKALPPARTLPPKREEGANAQPVATKRHALILCGHPGDAEHAVQFKATVEKLSAGLAKTAGIPPERQRIVFGADAKILPAKATGPCTRDAATKAIEDTKKALGPDDGLWVVCLGHGHQDARGVWWNLPGPDLSAKEFGKLFEDVACKQQVFVMTMSLSGFFVKPLAKKGRAAIAATEADAEPNETTFPNVLADLLATGLDPAEQDFDKDGKPSLFDLYIATARGVAEGYAGGEFLATEHQQLDDDGDGRGHEPQSAFLPPEQGGDPPDQKAKRRQPDGALAKTIMLVPKVAEKAEKK